MLLPLLGACAVVGPFQGPEWEPVQGLLSQDQSCRDPRCCGNLLVFCLFLIWQIQQYWHQITRTSKRNVIKVPLQRWVVPSIRRESFFGMIPDFFWMIPDFFSHGKTRGLDDHVQLWAQKQRWGYKKILRQPWPTQYLLPPQRPCRDPPWVVHTHSEPLFSTSSFSRAPLLPQNHSWEAWQGPWCPRDGQTHPSMNMCQRMEQLLAPSQEKLMPVEPVSVRCHPTSTALTISFPNFPSAQRPEFGIREFPPDPPNQQLEMCTWNSWNNPQDPLEPRDETQTIDREYSEDTQALQCTKQRARRRVDDWETQASGGQLPVGFTMEDDAEATILGFTNQMLLIRETDDEIPMPTWRNQDQMRVKNRVKAEKLWKGNQREPSKDPFTQAHMGEKQEHFRCETDIVTQTPEWENQDDAVETQPFEKEKEKEARWEEEGGVQAQGGLGTQGRTGSENTEASQMLTWGTQEQAGGNTGAESEAQEGSSKSQTGGEDELQIQASGKENLGEVKQDEAETQALEYSQQGCPRDEGVIQGSVGEKPRQNRSEEAGVTQASKREEQRLSRPGVQEGMRKLREIREEDWVVIQAPWWGNQRLVVSEVDRDFETPCRKNQNQVGGGHTAEIQSLGSDRRKGGDEDATNHLTTEAENQGQLRGKTDTETDPARRKNKDKTEMENGTDNQVLEEENLKEVKGEDDAQAQELGQENQGQLGNEFHKNIDISKRKNEEHIYGNNGTDDIPSSETEKGEELTTNVDDVTDAAGGQEVEKAKGEDSTEIHIEGMMTLRGAGEKEGAEETKATPEESQSWLGSAMGVGLHLPELKNRKQMGGEEGTKVQALEKTHQKEAGDDAVKTKRPKRENQRKLKSKTRGSHSTRWRSQKQAGGKNASENMASRRNWRREAGSEDVRQIQRLRRKEQKLLRSKRLQKTYSSQWEGQKNGGTGNGAEIQIEEKRSQRSSTGGDGPETQASAGDDQGQSVCESYGEIQTQGQRIQNQDGGEDAVGDQRECRAEDAGQSLAPRRRDKGQVRGKDDARNSLQGDSSGAVGSTGRKCSLAQPPALAVSGYGAPRHKQPVAVDGVNSAPCSKTKPDPHCGEVFPLGEKRLANQGTAPASQHRAGVRETSQQAQPASQRQRQMDKGIDLGKASSLTGQPWYPQSQTLSVFPSLLCGQVSQAAMALASSPTALPTVSQWPALKKSKRLLLESLMKRRIAHLRWGLPRRILESYLLFHFLESSPSMAGVGLTELQRHQERHCEAQGSSLGLKSPERSQSFPALERKSSKLRTQARALEKCRPPKSEPLNSSIPPKMPRRIRPAGGAKEPQIQEEAPKAKIPAPRNPKPAAGSRSWCGPGSAQELSSQNSRGRKMIRLGVSQMAERASSRVSASSSTSHHNYWKMERVPWETSESPRLKCQQPVYCRGRRAEPVESRRAWQQPSSCSTHTPSFKGNVHSAAARLSMTILNKMPWPPQPQHSNPYLTLRNPTLLPHAAAPLSKKDSIRVHTAVETDLQFPGDCCARVIPPKTESYQGQEVAGNPNGMPRSPPAQPKFGLIKHLRCFLRQCGFKK